MFIDLSPLFDGADVIERAADATLFRSGDRVRMMYRVMQGSVALARIADNGEQRRLHHANTGDVLAEASAYSADYHCDAVALCQTSLQALPVDVFLARLDDDPIAARAWGAHIAHTLQAARHLSDLRTLKTVAQRYDRWLQLNDGRAETMQIQAIVQEIAVSREALYRELARRRQALSDGSASNSNAPTS